MKAFSVILICLLPFMIFGQCWTQYGDFLKTEVKNDTVIIKDDTACRGCLAYIVNEVTRLNGDTLKWLQVDYGPPVYCMCNFNLSVTIDSLSQGFYTALVYLKYPSLSNEYFIGSVDFTISASNSFSQLQKHDEYQSECFQVGIQEATNRISELKVYPNPGKDFLNINTDISGVKFIRISNVQNKLVKEFTSDQYDNLIDISNLPPNIYFITVKSEDKLLHAKFCKY